MSSSTKRRVSHEVISDSEPEREALRRRVKETNRSKKALSMLPVSTIIELTDDESTNFTIADDKGIQTSPQGGSCSSGECDTTATNIPLVVPLSQLLTHREH